MKKFVLVLAGLLFLGTTILSGCTPGKMHVSVHKDGNSHSLSGSTLAPDGNDNGTGDDGNTTSNCDRDKHSNGKGNGHGGKGNGHNK